jgi:SNF2 family DNA or RNA helicase
MDSDPAENCIKYRRLIEILEEIFSNNEKVLVFTSWQKMTDIIVDDVMRRFGVYANRIDGRVDVKERQLIVDRFNKMDAPGVLVLNPVAGGVGLNITGANHVVHYNLEWNPAVVDQATARAYRRGQEKPVTVHRLYYINTVEDVINERLDFKRQISDTAVVGVTGQDEDYKYILDALRRTPTWTE